MPRLFLSTSFVTHVDKSTGTVNGDFRNNIEAVLDALQSLHDLEVFCAVQYEKWMISKDPPEVSIRKDIDEIKKADIVLALLTEGSSTGGQQFEIGLAYGLGKKVLIASSQDTKLGFFNQGVVNAGYAEHIVYTRPDAITEKIKAMI